METSRFFTFNRLNSHAHMKRTVKEAKTSKIFIFSRSSGKIKQSFIGIYQPLLETPMGNILHGLAVFIKSF
jgi:hypothetical protein